MVKIGLSITNVILRYIHVYQNFTLLDLLLPQLLLLPIGKLWML